MSGLTRMATRARACRARDRLDAFELSLGFSVDRLDAEVDRPCQLRVGSCRPR